MSGVDVVDVVDVVDEVDEVDDPDDPAINGTVPVGIVVIGARGRLGRSLPAAAAPRESKRKRPRLGASHGCQNGRLGASIANYW